MTHQVGDRNNYQNCHQLDSHKTTNQQEDSPVEEEDSPAEEEDSLAEGRSPRRRRISRRRRSTTWRTTQRRMGTTPTTNATSTSRETRRGNPHHIRWRSKKDHPVHQ